MLQWKLTDLTVKIFCPLIQSVIINWFNSEIYFFTGESVKRQITDSICENLTDSDLESSSTKIRHQAKVDNFSFKNSNIIIEGLIRKRKDYFQWKKC